MAILPKNKSLSIEEYEKKRKDVVFDTQTMFDVELFFKRKEDEILQQIIDNNELNDDYVDDDFDNLYYQNQKKSA